MKCRSDSSGGGDEHRALAAAATGDGGSGEPSKKQRTEEPPPSSSGAGECSSASASASAQAPPPPTQREQLPPDAREGEQPQQGSESGGGEQARVPDFGEDLVFEVLMRAEARTLARAACVSRGWRQLARDERLWEAACVRDWANTGFSELMLRSVVLSLGGFRRLHERYILPVQQRGAGAPPAPPGQQRRQAPARMGRDQVQVSLSLLSTSFFQKMPNAPPPPPKKGKDNDRDRNGGV